MYHLYLQKIFGINRLMPLKIDYKAKSVMRIKKGCFMMIKISIHQEDMIM